MARTTLTSKGQVTIPSSVREALRLQAGDQLLIDLTEYGFSASVVRKPEAAELMGIFGHVARPGTTRAEERETIGKALGQKQRGSDAD